MHNLTEELMGSTIYRLFEEENDVKTYGISVMSENDHEEIHNVTATYETAYNIYETLIRNAVSPVHLKYVITDLISC